MGTNLEKGPESSPSYPFSKRANPLTFSRFPPRWKRASHVLQTLPIPSSSIPSSSLISLPQTEHSISLSEYLSKLKILSTNSNLLSFLLATNLPSFSLTSLKSLTISSPFTFIHSNPKYTSPSRLFQSHSESSFLMFSNLFLASPVFWAIIMKCPPALKTTLANVRSSSSIILSTTSQDISSR
ncbi:182aa long hypothetical protein [Pyrococcus horikoshii OT3]|uniref:Uncharacterized protein n=1 Tax=Pyrococcus horikoshii (strain ATCC 700860 / DSM 12428 / JCM 9974 / NBRC 100139 / OT-3) TaxID=70601 RepID=O57902_PYRHO|nr:182aa long hypothetical protein [Pyrococcus horikoshii OT3]